MGARPSSFVKEAVEVKVERQWSPEQLAIFEWFEGTGTAGCSCGDDHPHPQHLIVDALAGVGKTTTLIEGVNRAPDPYVLICAFNKQIAEELQRRSTRANVDAKTMHSLGYFFVRREWRGIKVADRAERASQLTMAVTDKRVPLPVCKMVNALHTKGRELIPTTYSIERLVALAVEFDLEPDEGWQNQFSTEWIATQAYLAMKWAAEHPPTYDVGIDFADMMFLPFAWNLLEPMYDLVVVDEFQDFSKAQLQMAQGVCRGRIAGFGDRHQAIYGFRGADTGAMARMQQELQAGVLPLHTTYRCAQAVTREAQRLVPDLKAAATNPEGTVQGVGYADMLADAAPGDFIVSRLNAPLVLITLTLLLQRKRAKMRGRDIGQQLVALVRRLAGRDPRQTIDGLLQRVDTWEQKTSTKMYAMNMRDMAERVKDQAAMIRAFADGCPTIAKLVQDIEFLFVDVTDSETILCTSIHKVKGLEAQTVYVLQETLYRRGDSDEERNCDYVAKTRAIEHLRYVQGVPGMEKR